MANEITITATLAATNPFGSSVSHSMSSKQFTMKGAGSPPTGAGENDVFKETVATTTTTYVLVPLGTVTFAKKPVIFVTNRCPADAATKLYLLLTLDNGTTVHSQIPPQGTVIIWADPAGTDANFKAKWDATTGSNNIYEVTAAETDV